MTDITAASQPPRQRAKPADRPDILLPSGETLRPRIRWAQSVGLSEKTARRLNLKTTYIGGVAYVANNASLEQLAAHLKRRNEPPRRRRHGGG